MATARLPEVGDYLPPRLPVGERALKGQSGACAGQPGLRALLEAHPTPTLVLNGSRQIVAANRAALRLADNPGGSVVGLRIGELVGCERSVGRPGTCGTQPGCELCGAAQALSGLEATGSPSAAECRIAAGRRALDLRISASHLSVGNELLTLCAVEDTSDRCRRQALERVFFHDALNVAGALQGYLSLWNALGPDEALSMGERLGPLADQLVDEIQAQRDLLEAERGELVPHLATLGVAELFGRLDAVYRLRAQESGVTLAFRHEPATAHVRSDAVLLRRVLGNLIKNGLEASAPGDTLRVTFSGQLPGFEVWNAAVMPEAVRRQMFQRSFSTKEGRGRGLGTYSVKLLTERYLGGSVSFRSGPGCGTTFTVAL